MIPYICYFGVSAMRKHSQPRSVLKVLHYDASSCIMVISTQLCVHWSRMCLFVHGAWWNYIDVNILVDAVGRWYISLTICLKAPARDLFTVSMLVKMNWHTPIQSKKHRIVASPHRSRCAAELTLDALQILPMDFPPRAHLLSIPHETSAARVAKDSCKWIR